MPQEKSFYFAYDFTHARMLKLEQELLGDYRMDESLEDFFTQNMNLFRDIHDQLYYGFDEFDEVEQKHVRPDHLLYEGLEHYKLSSLNRHYFFRLEELLNEQRRARSQAEKDLIQADIDRMNILTFNDMKSFADKVKTILVGRGYLVDVNVIETNGIVRGNLSIRWD